MLTPKDALKITAESTDNDFLLQYAEGKILLEARKGKTSTKIICCSEKETTALRAALNLKGYDTWYHRNVLYREGDTKKQEYPITQWFVNADWVDAAPPVKKE